MTKWIVEIFKSFLGAFFRPALFVWLIFFNKISNPIQVQATVAHLQRINVTSCVFFFVPNLTVDTNIFVPSAIIPGRHRSILIRRRNSTALSRFKRNFNQRRTRSRSRYKILPSRRSTDMIQSAERRDKWSDLTKFSLDSFRHRIGSVKYHAIRA